MAQAAIPLMIASAAFSAVGSMAAGQQNKALLQSQAREEQSQGVAERVQVRSAARATMARQVMAAAESGFVPNVGTARSDLEESLINRELDLMTSKRNASARAAGLNRQAKYAAREGAFGAVSALLGGATQVSTHKAQMKAAGE
jgi:hypothetical protein